MSVLLDLLDGDAAERAQIGTLVHDAVEGAIAEIDSGAGDYSSQNECEAICADARTRFADVIALLDDPDAAVRSSGCIALAGLALGAWDMYAESMKMAEFPALLVSAVERLPFADGEADVRAAALEPLRHIHGATDALSVATDRALDLLSDPAPLVRAKAIHVIAHRFRGRADLAAVHPLCDDEDPLVEQALVECLVEQRDAAVAPVVLRRARRERLAASSETIRQLKMFGVTEARELLLEIMPDASDEYTRAYAADALVEHVAEDCIPALRRTFALGDFASEFATIALTRLGERAAHPDNARWIAARAANPPHTYREDLDSFRSRLIAFSARMIGVAGDAVHAPALLDALDTEAAVRVEPGSAGLMHAHFFELAFALGLLGHRPAYASITTQLRRGRNHCLALGMLGDPRALPALAAIIQREAPDGQQATNDLVRMQRDAALAIAAIDLDAVDAAVLAAADRGWPARELAFKVDFVLALKQLARRLAIRREHPNATRMRDLLRRRIRPLEPLVAETISHHRNGAGAHEAYGYVLRDWLDTAMRDLAP